MLQKQQQKHLHNHTYTTFKTLITANDLSGDVKYLKPETGAEQMLLLACTTEPAKALVHITMKT